MLEPSLIYYPTELPKAISGNRGLINKTEKVIEERGKQVSTCIIHFLQITSKT